MLDNKNDLTNGGDRDSPLVVVGDDVEVGEKHDNLIIQYIFNENNKITYFYINRNIIFILTIESHLF